MESTKPTLNEAENGNKSKPLLVAGQIVWLDYDLANKSKVEVVEQTPQRMFTTVKDPKGDYIWSVMTYRLMPCH